MMIGKNMYYMSPRDFSTRLKINVYQYKTDK
jgi:hypothetical protein